jgi:hypothetical protein
MFAIYSKVANIVRVHYSHLTETVADNEVERLNSHLVNNGQTAAYWCEQHHPECTFVIN